MGLEEALVGGFGPPRQVASERWVLRLRFNGSPRAMFNLETAAPRGTSEVDKDGSSDPSSCSGLESLGPREDVGSPREGAGERSHSWFQVLK